MHSSTATSVQVQAPKPLGAPVSSSEQAGGMTAHRRGFGVMHLRTSGPQACTWHMYAASADPGCPPPSGRPTVLGDSHTLGRPSPGDENEVTNRTSSATVNPTAWDAGRWEGSGGQGRWRKRSQPARPFTAYSVQHCHLLAGMEDCRNRRL